MNSSGKVLKTLLQIFKDLQAYIFLASALCNLL